MNNTPVLINGYILKQAEMLFGFNVKYNQEVTWMETWNVLSEESLSYKVLQDIGQLHQYLEIVSFETKNIFWTQYLCVL